MKQTIKQPYWLYIAFILVALFSFTFETSAQTVKVDAQGNYVAVKATRDSTSAKQTGKTYTDSKGIVYPVYVSKNGKLFVRRISAKGNAYNYYLKLN